MEIMDLGVMFPPDTILKSLLLNMDPVWYEIDYV
jgi:hypothetical protein